MKRRELIQTAALTAAGAGISIKVSAETDDFPLEVIDTNVSLFQWPFRRLPLDDTEALVSKLRTLGVMTALAGSYEALLHRGLATVNRRLAGACEKFEELIPVGTVNPLLPGWEGDLERCLGEWKMKGIRLYPTCHGYQPDHPGFKAILEKSAGHRFIVQVAATVEDTRTQPDFFRTPDLDFTRLAEAVARYPDCRVQVLNWRPRGAIPEGLAKHPGVFFDTARADGTDGVAKLADAVSADRVVFGSHAPFLIPAAALIRTVHESQLDDASLRKVVNGNANSMLQWSMV